LSMSNQEGPLKHKVVALGAALAGASAASDLQKSRAGEIQGFPA
jgi:hypothetical protein